MLRREVSRCAPGQGKGCHWLWPSPPNLSNRCMPVASKEECPSSPLLRRADHFKPDQHKCLDASQPPFTLTGASSPGYANSPSARIVTPAGYLCLECAYGYRLQKASPL